MKSLLLGAALVLFAGCKSSSETTEVEVPELIETRHLISEEYESFIATPGKLTVVMFHADWCAPCNQLAPVLEEVIEEFEGKAVLGMINVDDSSELAKSLGVVGIPDVRLFRDGVMVDAMKGVIPKGQLRNHLAIQVAQVGGATGLPKATTEPAVKPMEKDWLPPGIEPR